MPSFFFKRKLGSIHQSIQNPAILILRLFSAEIHLAVFSDIILLSVTVAFHSLFQSSLLSINRNMVSQDAFLLTSQSGNFWRGSQSQLQGFKCHVDVSFQIFVSNPYAEYQTPISEWLSIPTCTSVFSCSSCQNKILSIECLKQQH